MIASFSVKLLLYKPEQNIKPGSCGDAKKESKIKSYISKNSPNESPVFFVEKEQVVWNIRVSLHAW